MKDRFALAIVASLAMHLFLMELVRALDLLWPAERQYTERQFIPVSLLEMDSPAERPARPEASESRRAGEKGYPAAAPAGDRSRPAKHAGPVVPDPRKALDNLPAGPEEEGAGPAGKISRPAEVANCGGPAELPLREAKARDDQAVIQTVAVAAAPADNLHPGVSMPSQGADRCVTGMIPGDEAAGADTAGAGASRGDAVGGGGQGDGKTGKGAVQVPDEFLASNPPPRYPLTARRKGWEGTVVIDIHVSGSGWVEEARIEKSSGYTVLDAAALGAVRHWRIAGSDKADRNFRIPVIFKLNPS